MEKPNVLFHGSDAGGLKEIEPRQANGVGDNENDRKKAVYATHIRKHAIAFALTIEPVKEDGKWCRDWYLEYPDGYNGEPVVVIVKGKFDETKNAYLYTLPSDSFERDKGGSKQWLSYEPVVPVGEPEVICAKDYSHWVMTEKEYLKWLEEREKGQQRQLPKQDFDIDKEPGALLNRNLTDKLNRQYINKNKNKAPSFN